LAISNKKGGATKGRICAAVAELLEERRLLATVAIPTGASRDLLVDNTHNVLYATTNAGLQRYDITTGTLLAPVVLHSGPSLPYGLDITPDDSTIYVADAADWLYKVRLSDGAVTQITFTKPFTESGPYDIVIGANGLGFVSTRYQGSGWTPLRQIDLATDTLSIRSDYDQAYEAHFERTNDRSTIVVLESDLAYYNAATDSFTHLSPGGASPMPLSPDGKMLASTPAIRDKFLSTLKTLTGIDGGGIFDPNRPIFYGVNTSTDQVIAYDTTTFAEKYRLGVGENLAAGIRYLAVNSAGTLLFAPTATGIRKIDIPQPSAVASFATLSGFPALVKTGITNPITVRILDSAGEAATTYRGTIHFTSNDPSASLPGDYTFIAADNGVHTFNVTFNSAGTRTITITDAANSLTATQSGITIHNGAVSLIPLTDHRDVVLDSVHNILYASTTNGTLERYNLTTQSLMPPIYLGSVLNGMDITPDGDFMYVADGIHNDTQGFVKKVDLNTGSVTLLSYNLGTREGGAYDIVIMNANRAFLTTIANNNATNGAMPFRQLDLATDTFSIRSDIPTTNSHSIMDRSRDRDALLLQESYAAFGIFYYDVSSDSWKKISTDHWPFSPSTAGALNADGSLVARQITGVNTSGVYIRDASLALVKTLSGASQFAFDPIHNVFYGAAPPLTPQIIAYDTTTWAEKYRIDSVESYYTFFFDYMSINDAGTILYFTTPSGVRPLTIPQPTAQGTRFTASGFPSFIKTNVPGTITINVRDPVNEPATLYRGTIHFTSTDPQAILPPNYTFTAADAGTHSFNITFKTVSANQTITITDIASSLTASQSGIRVHSGSTTIPIVAHDTVYDPQRNLLYITSSNGNVERYNPTTQSFLSPITIGSALNGIDITPDYKYIVVATSIRDGDDSYFMKIGLDTLAVTGLPYTRAFGEGVAWDVAIANNGAALVSTIFDGSGTTPLRQLNLSANTFVSRRTVQGSTNIARGAARNLLYFIEPNISSGPAFTYDPATDTFPVSRNFSYSQSGNIATINRDGSLITVERGSSTDILNPTDLSLITSLTGIDGGIIFDPAHDLLIGIKSATDQIIAYRTSNWTVKWQILAGEALSSSTPMGSGGMSLSPDGNQLYLTTGVDIATYTIGGSPTVTNFPSTLTSVRGNFTVTYRNPNGSIDTDFRGAIHFTSSDPAAILPPDYTFTAADAGVHTFSATFNTINVTTATPSPPPRPPSAPPANNPASSSAASSSLPMS
jgi:DNA-binding beta-propeller fold protein YncE